ncbi:MAG TPA: flagellar type III secretion system pore protein FliP [Nevskiaceae bacterium]|nr:flagellar type III secretion system pore protein FliP [Nevskiaceae bacterium]
MNARRGWGSKRVALTAAGVLIGAMMLHPVTASAAQALPPLLTSHAVHGGTQWSIPLQTLLLLTSLAFIPAILLMMTGFTRIIVVLSLLRSALGTSTTPPNQVLLGLALFLTFFVMQPTMQQAYRTAWVPLEAGTITAPQALDKGVQPFETFMLRQTRKNDIAMFDRLAKAGPIKTPADTPLRVLVPAFVVSELKTAFQIGFTIFIPFLIIDLVVASVLMALGMMMVPPSTVSLPFKLMLFVMVDGWHLIVGSMVQSFVR